MYVNGAKFYSSQFINIAKIAPSLHPSNRDIDFKKLNL